MWEFLSEDGSTSLEVDEVKRSNGSFSFAEVCRKFFSRFLQVPYFYIMPQIMEDL